MQSRKAFTMIELIFVIVIIGILASVAIPKLAATRDDAIAIQVIHNLKSYLKDVRNYYMSKGKQNYIAAPVNQVTEVVIMKRVNCTGIATSIIPGKTMYLCANNIPYVRLGATNLSAPNQRIIFSAMNTGTVVGSILSSNRTFNQLTKGDSSDPYKPNKSFLIESSNVNFD